MVGAFSILDRFRSEPSTQLGAKPVLTATPIPIGDAPTRGSRDARVALVVFSDLQCPVCARATQELLPGIQARYIDTGKVLLVWHHDPLQIHPAARGAAEAAECANRQGKFWDLHDWAFRHQDVLPTIRNAAKDLGLDMPTFDRCVKGEGAARVSSDLALAEQLGVTGTPTWFVGTIESSGNIKPVDQIVGLGPIDVYSKVIDRLIESR